MRQLLLILLTWIMGGNLFCQSSITNIGNNEQRILNLEKIQGAKPKNVIFILSDDHRYDFFGFTGKVPWLETPTMDKLAVNGAHFLNAFVSTSLCSPSRASILTGEYAHTHKIVDNVTPDPGTNIYFPQYLQKAGYQTAFIGKWHMGGVDFEPRKGFDRWVSFKGQGTYFNVRLNVDGKVIQCKDSAYTTDVLTDYAIDFVKNRNKNKPFFLYLSHKAIHAMFKPAPQDLGRYNNVKIPYPKSMNITATNEYKKYDIPEWVKNQRYSWHGVDYMYHGQITFNDFYKQYCETLYSLDRNIGKLMDYLTEAGLDSTTMILYMGDNGFSFGEHGLIDKRQSYEQSMRIPLLAYCPQIITPETKISGIVQNIDIAPTILDLAGLKAPTYMQGRSFLPLMEGKDISWRDTLYYEYYWEYAFPQTPTTFAVRTQRYKYVFHYGIWDANEFYDLKQDPDEIHNLIRNPEQQKRIRSLQKSLWKWLENTGGMEIPLKKVTRPKFDRKFQGYY